MLSGALGVFGLGILHADGPTISGFIDTTYNYSFNKPFTGTTALRSYDANDNNITLNTAHLNFVGSMGSVGYTIETDYGMDASADTSTGSGASDDFDVQEAYLTYACPVTGLNLKAGKFVTPEGIEVIESKDNPTISRGFLFGLAEPFTHVGAMVSRTFGKLDLGVGVINGWDQTSDSNDGKTVLGKIGLNLGDPLALTLTGYHGPEQANTYSTSFATNNVTNDGNNRSTVDLTGVTKVIPKVALWFQFNYGQEEKAADKDGDGTNDDLATWGGFTIQPVVSITDKFSIGARFENMEDPDGARTAQGVTHVSINNWTIAPAYKMTDNMTVRVEYRMDSSNKKIWTDEDGTSKDSNSSATAQFIVTF
jgi:hypothetical protein